MSHVETSEPPAKPLTLRERLKDETARHQVGATHTDGVVLDLLCLCGDESSGKGWDEALEVHADHQAAALVPFIQAVLDEKLAAVRECLREFEARGRKHSRGGHGGQFWRDMQARGEGYLATAQAGLLAMGEEPE